MSTGLSSSENFQYLVNYKLITSFYFHCNVAAKCIYDYFPWNMELPEILQSS